jgi:hypothetical protein
MFASDLIDVDALLEVIWVSLAAGVGGTAAFSIGLAGAARCVDMRRAGRGGEAILFGAVAALGLGVCLAAVVFGLYEITSK